MTPPPGPPDDLDPLDPLRPDPDRREPAGPNPLDPFFADLDQVSPRPSGEPATPAAGPPADAPETPSRPPEPPAEPVRAEPVGRPDDLPIAEPVGPRPPEPPPTRAEPVPRARPAPPRGRPVDAAPPRRDTPAPPPAPAEAPTRPRVFTACCVVGCLGGAVVGSLGFLAFAAIAILGQLGDRFTDRDEARTRPGPVVMSKLADAHKTVPLRGEVDAVGRAAGGRYLVLRVPSVRQLAVFDPVEAAVVKTVPLDEPGALFAGSRSWLFVWSPKGGTLDRYDLATFERERAGTGPPGDPVALVTGSAADGPVFAISRRPAQVEAQVVDPATLQVTASHPLPDWPTRTEDASHVRASADGRVIGIATIGAWKAVRRAVVFRFDPAAGFAGTPLKRGDEVFGHVHPSPDGRFLYTARGVFSPDGKERVGGDDDPGLYTFPAAHGDALFLSLARDPGEDPAPRTLLRRPVRLHLAGDARPAATLGEVEPPTGLDAWDANALPADLRVHLWPAAGLTAVLPADSKRLELYRVDVAARLAKEAGRNYVVIGSDPPTAAARGARWSYRPVVWSRPTGDPTLTVSGPPGMVVSGDEAVWNVPARFTDDEVPVTVRAEAGGRKAEQTFRVTVSAAPGR